MAQMLKGGVVMDVVNVEQARIAEEAGACAVMALERVPEGRWATLLPAPSAPVPNLLSSYTCSSLLAPDANPLPSRAKDLKNEPQDRGAGRGAGDDSQSVLHTS